MVSNAKLAAILESVQLPSPKGVALSVILLTQQENVSNLQLAHAIKADPALSGLLIKVANNRFAGQSRHIASVLDAVTLLGFNTIRQLVLGLSLMDEHRAGRCASFDYPLFWSHALLAAITAQNLVMHSKIGSGEEAFVLGLLGDIGTLAFASVYPLEYGRLLETVERDPDKELKALELAEFGFDHNQLTQAMLADWGMPKVFQDVIRYHDDPTQSDYEEDTRTGRLLYVLHIAGHFARVCLNQPQRRKMIPQLILVTTRYGVELAELTRLGDQSLCEWREWSSLCGILPIQVPRVAELLAAAPLEMTEHEEELPGSSTFYPLRILLVDDDRAIILLLTTLLKKLGHTVMTAGTGIEGLANIEIFKPQLIITDWIMPQMNGIEFCRALRKNPAWRNIYVFIMTAQTGEDSLIEAFEAGANDYMTKPLRPKLLAARLRAAQRVVQLQDEIEFDRGQLHKFANELVNFNHRLRKSDMSMRAILDNSPYLTWLKDAEGHYIKINDKYLQYCGQQDTAQVIGKTDFDLWPKEFANKYQADDNTVMAQRQQMRFEESIPDGNTLRWVETFKTPVIDENGKLLGTTGFARDISERKRLEHDLQESELRYRTVANYTSDWEYWILPDQSFRYMSPSCEQISGYTAAEFYASPQLLTRIIHPDDLPYYIGHIHKISTQGLSEPLDFRIYTKSGELRWLSHVCQPVYDEQGQHLGQRASNRDISERKHTEQMLTDSERGMKELFENLRSGVAMYQASADGQDFIITAFNHAAECIDKVKREDLLGKNVADVFPGIIEFGLLDVFRRVWKSGVAEHYPVSFYQDGKISGWRENYVYKLTRGDIVAIYDDVTQEKQAEEKISYQANYDALTGLPNRTLFDDRLSRSLATAKRDKTQLALMFLDLDKFKPVNDTYGHDVGDLLLIAAAQRMLACVRESDTVSRAGGDEFVLLLPGIQTEQDALQVAEKLLIALNRPFELSGYNLSISASIGIAIFPEHGDTEKALAKQADIAMYYAKGNGRNRAQLYRPEL
ncbi:MAG: diguanylate cyclase [Gallionella sp.]|jgi:diguanylate cyclase (GGDEF)-like protein/PAS domain S-box-containing protein